MQATPIRSAEDLRAIEAAGLAHWMPHTRVISALEAVASQHGSRIALTALSHAEDMAPRRWSYDALLRQICRSAHALHALAAPAEPRVALLMPALPEAWFALWGAETAGVACPINHALGDDHLVALLNAAAVNLVVTLAPGHPAGDVGDRVQRLRSRCLALRTVVTVAAPEAAQAGRHHTLGPGTVDFNDVLASASDRVTEFHARVDPHRVAALFHTGGTTGVPKLAQHTESNQLHAAWGAARLYDATEHDVILNGFPLFHVAGAFVYGLSMWLAGAHIVLPPPAGWRDAAFVARAWRIVAEHRVSLLAMVPTVMTALLQAPGCGVQAASAVRLALTGGSPLPTELAHQFEAQTGIAVRNILGMTECAGVIAIEPALAPRTPGSCGLPLPFSEVRMGDDGVLRLRGPNVGPGYTDAARNAGSFEGGWLITGDVGHVDAEARVYVTGRAKDLIIRGAHNIDPAVIEEALLQHPEVALAAAVGEPDEYAGELPVAFVVAKPGATVTDAELLSFAAAHVAERAAVPKRITQVAALPLTAIGKVYKPGLRVMACERVLHERLCAAGLDAWLQVHGEDRSGALFMHFAVHEGLGASQAASPPAPDASRAALLRGLQQLMAGFALKWDMA